jgi:purine-binding chemotaxis protein CheW
VNNPASNEKMIGLLVFSLDQFLYALPLSFVQRVFRAAEITPLPGAPEVILGVLNIHGEIAPVFNLRKRFGLKDKDIELSDQMIFVKTANRKAVLICDQTLSLIERPEQEILEAADIVLQVKYLEGVIKLPDGLVLIHNPDHFLFHEEEQTLDALLEQ